MRYGRLLVLYYSEKRTSRTAICRCDCGNVKEIYLSNLKSQKTRSCGCLEEKRKKYIDLTGKRFGSITAVAATEKRDSEGNIIWKCHCDCGNTFFYSGRYLRRGYKKDCGCKSKERLNIQNKRFGALVAVKALDKPNNSRVKWLCQCDCGRKCVIRYGNLLSGHTKSCGCLAKKEHRTRVDGTVAECLMTKLSKNNTSGIKGVYRSRGKWVAYISLAGKRYYLGSYDDILDAEKARRKAEEEMFHPILKKAQYIKKQCKD